MANPIIKFNQNTVTGKKGTSNSYQTKRYPEGVILYTTSAELPDSLSDNALIFTTDTAELYVGTGTGIKKLKLGSEADLNPAIYLKIDTARAIYQNKIQAETKANEIKEQIANLKESVYTRDDIDKFITEDLDLNGIVDKMNFYTVERINQLLEERAAATNVYTRAQADEIYNTKANVSTVEELSEQHQNLETTVTELSSLVDTKAAIADTYNKTEIDTVVTDIRNGVTTNANNITALQNNSAVASEVNAEFDSVKADITDLQNNKANVTAVETKDQQLEENISNVSRNLEDLTVNVYEKTEIDTKVQTLESSISAVDNKIVETASNIRNEIVNVNDIVIENKSAINSNVQAIADNKIAIEQVAFDITALQGTVDTKANIADVYTKQEVSELLEAKANLDEVFKKIDTYSAEKIQELFAAEDETDLGLFYTKVEVDDKLDTKVDKETFTVVEAKADSNEQKISNLTDITIPGISDKVDAAVQSSSEALENATDAKNIASIANDTSIEAKASADFAKTSATEAKILANSVTSTAEAANEKSDLALETARTAEDAVGEATRAADRLTTRVASVELNFAALRNNVVDVATFTTELNKKADATLLDFKASKVEVEQGLLLKTNKTDFEALQDVVDTKAAKTYVDQQLLDAKTEINTTITTNVNTINNTISNIETSMLDMAKTDDVDKKLAKKADANKVYTKEEVDALINDAVTQVLNELALKLLGQE